jgi:hypothetical protein
MVKNIETYRLNNIVEAVLVSSLPLSDQISYLSYKLDLPFIPSHMSTFNTFELSSQLFVISHLNDQSKSSGYFESHRILKKDKMDNIFRQRGLESNIFKNGN